MQELNVKMHLFEPNSESVTATEDPKMWCIRIINQKKVSHLGRFNDGKKYVI